MRKFLFIAAVMLLSLANAYGQTVKNSSFQTIANIKSDGTIQDDSYRTIGYAKGLPARWATYYFFFFRS